ncbi:MAG: hypothetical protein H7330_08005 [Hymenobacteraceae bacterium]|nr:hypothetical protein [Hymenobacteraceae bacterium]
MLQIKDIFLTPIYIIIIYVIAMYFRPKVTTPVTIRYYMPALYLKLAGSIALGLLYTFYYEGGDTGNYFYHIKIVNDAFWTSPAAGLELIFSHGQYSPNLATWVNKMWWYHAPAEFMVIRIGSILSLVSFCTYLVIAMLFALLSFSGMWAMFRTFLKLYPHLHRQFAIALFYMPSVFFWGSGLMKDSLCLGGLGWLLYALYQALIERKNFIQSGLIIVGVTYVILIMKAYIILAFMPPALFWIINEFGRRIQNRVARQLLTPVFVAVGLAAAVFGLTRVTAGNTQFDLDRVAERAKITSDYIYRVSLEQGGAAYTLGEVDGTISGMLRLAPQAINVTLFRPYIWEVRNFIMFFSSMESAVFLFLTLTLIWRTGFFKTIRLIVSVPILQLCFTFALLFSMSVGLSTNNFGTLARYKVQMMPFYLSGLYIANHLSAESRRQRRLAFARA